MGIAIHWCLVNLAYQSPILAALIAGVILAIRRWKDAPRAMLLVCLGLGVCGVEVLGTTTMAFVVILVHSAPTHTMLIVMSVVSILLRAACLGLLIAGALAGRRREGRGFPVQLAERTEEAAGRP